MLNIGGNFIYKIKYILSNNKSGCRYGEKMKIVLYILSVAAGGLSLVAALSQMKAEKRSFSHILMALGSLVLLAAIVCNLANRNVDWFLALIGTGMICTAAVWNGKKSGSLHLQHHVVRILISIILVAGYVFF